MLHEEEPVLPYEEEPTLLWHMPKGQPEALLALLLQANARYLDWAEYWYDDEPHTGEFALYDEALRPVYASLARELPAAADGILWSLAHAFDLTFRGSYGHFRLDAVERTVTKLGEAHYEVVVTAIPANEQEQIELAVPLAQQERAGALHQEFFCYAPEPLDADGLERLLAVLAAEGVARVEWVTYWHEEARHLDQYTFFDAAGVSLATTVHEGIRNYWGSREGQVRRALEQAGAPEIHTVLWLASHAFTTPDGHFRLVVPERRIYQIGDAQFTVRRDPWPEGQRPCLRL